MNMAIPPELAITITPQIVRVAGAGRLNQPRRGCLLPSVARQLAGLIERDQRKPTDENLRKSLNQSDESDSKIPHPEETSK